MTCDGRCLRIEQRVEQCDHLGSGKAVGTRGKTAQIRRPQHGGDFLAGAAADLAGENFWAGFGAEISVKDVAGDAALAAQIGKQRQALRHPRQIGDFACGEAAGAVGDIGRHVIDAERALERQGEIVGRALGLEIMQDREIERSIGDIEPAPHRFAGHLHPANRVIFVAVQILHFMGDEPEHGPAGGAPPDKVGAEILRVQRAQLQGRPQQRKTRRQHPPREFVELARQRRSMLRRGPPANPRSPRWCRAAAARQAAARPPRRSENTADPSRLSDPDQSRSSKAPVSANA